MTSEAPFGQAWRLFSVWRLGLTLGVLFAAALPAPGQSNGFQLFGRADFEMDAVQVADGRPLRLRYLAARRILRIEALDGSGEAMLIHITQGDIFVVVGGGQGGVFARRDRAIASWPVEAEDATRNIAGEICREARMDGGPACIADDGVPLMLGGPSGEVIAQRVLRQPQSPALFTLPKETKIQPFPGYRGPLPAVPF